MAKLSVETGKSVQVTSSEDVLMLIRNEDGSVSAADGHATVGTGTTSTPQSASIRLDVTTEWVKERLQQLGCNEDEVVDVVEQLFPRTEDESN